MSLLKLKLIQRVEAILPSACVESVLRPGSLLNIDLNLTVLHTDVRELIFNQRQRLVVPFLSNCCVLALAQEEDSKASYKEEHEATLHLVLLSKYDWVKRLF